MDRPLIYCEYFVERCQFQKAKCAAAGQNCNCGGDMRRCTWFDGVRDAGKAAEDAFVNGCEIPLCMKIRDKSRIYNEVVPVWVYEVIYNDLREL